MMFREFRRSPYILGRARSSVRPGYPRKAALCFSDILGSSALSNLELSSRAYSPGLKLLKGDGASTLALRGGFRMVSNDCSYTSVKYEAAGDLPKAGYHAEHLQEIQLPAIALYHGLKGTLPSGIRMVADRIDPAKLLATWNNRYAVSLARIGVLVTDIKGWTAPETPNERLFEVIGSHAFRGGMSLLWSSTNRIKGKVMRLQNPMSTTTWNSRMGRIVNHGSMMDAEHIAGVLQQTVGTLSYMNDAVLGDVLNDARGLLRDEWANYDHFQLPGMLEVWKEFEPDYYVTAAAKAQEFVKVHIHIIETRFATASHFSNPAAAKLLYDVGQLKQHVDKIKFTFDRDF